MNKCVSEKVLFFLKDNESVTLHTSHKFRVGAYKYSTMYPNYNC